MGTTQTQSRTLAKPSRIYVYYDNPEGTGVRPSSPSGEPAQTASTQVTTSYRSNDDTATDEELVKEWTTVTRNGFRTNSRFDNGHEFHTTKIVSSLSHPKFSFRIPSSAQDFNGLKFEGALVPNVQEQYRDIKPPKLTTSDISTLGFRAIVNTAPNRPSANLATMIGEILKDGLPSAYGIELLKNRMLPSGRGVGSEYLNHSFGWAPLVSDLTRQVRATLNASKVLSQWLRDSGRVVRRRYNFDEEVSTSFTPSVRNTSGAYFLGMAGSQGTAFFNVGSGGSGTGLPISMEETTRTKVWFSGAYQYALPDSESLLGKLKLYESQANHLLGIRITPDVLWELTPWSWLIDWVTSIGSSIKTINLLSSDGLVIRYGYLMRQTTQTRTFRIDGVRFYGGADVGSVSQRLTRVTKERVRSTPYGFGLNTSGFTASQWAILGALGLSKGPRSMY